MKKSLQTLFKQSHLGKALSTLMLSVFLTACGDERPVANMPDEPLAQPLEIVIEPKKVAMTSNWAAGVKDDGTLWTWGSGLGKIRKTTTGQPVDPTPMPVEGVNDAVAVSAGSHMLLLKKDGTVWGWGYNYNGEIDPTDKANFISELRKIEGISDVVDISAGSGSSVFVNRQGEVFYMGENFKTIFKNFADKDIIPLTQVMGLHDIVRVDANAGYILALDKNGNLFMTACKEGFKVVFQSEQNTICQIPFEKKVVDFAHGEADFALLSDGSVWTWGDLNNLAYETKNKQLFLPRRVKGLSKVVNVSDFSAMTEDGDLFIWGDYLVGKSTNPEASSMSRLQKPTRIAESFSAISFVRNAYISGLVTKTGEVWFWEGNRYGQRGTGRIVETFDEDFVFTPEKSLFTIR